MYTCNNAEHVILKIEIYYDDKKNRKICYLTAILWDIVVFALIHAVSTLKSLVKWVTPLLSAISISDIVTKLITAQNFLP